jgi:AIR synthase related protein, C-terminal domain
LFSAAHDLSLGGLAVGLFRFLYDPHTQRIAGFDWDPGATAALRRSGGFERDDLLLFGETNGCALVACAPGEEAALVGHAAQSGLDCVRLGRSTAGDSVNLGALQVSGGRAVQAFEGGLKSVFGIE